jgi:hypothetical protein
VTVWHEGDEPFLLNNGNNSNRRRKTDAETSKEWKRQKRMADESIVPPDDDNGGNFPSFIVVEAADGQPIKYSIFAIQKLLKCAVGDVKSAKKLRNGAVLIEVTGR